MKEIWDALWPELPTATLVAQTLVRLILAIVLGGVIGLEREYRHKPAGLRTNMFICFGAAMFTILSERLAGEFQGDHTRIAAQIIPGIGFIGAGCILHSRGGVSGLTTAATLFVVASIGMAAGGGLPMAAIFATIVILIALHLLGWWETRFSFKPQLMAYEARGASIEGVVSAINRVLDDEHRIMQTVQVGRGESEYRVQFTVECTRRENEGLMKKLREQAVLERLDFLGPRERE